MTPRPPPGLHQVLWDLGALPTSCLPHDHHGLVVLQQEQDVVPVLEHRQTLSLLLDGDGSKAVVHEGGAVVICGEKERKY